MKKNLFKILGTMAIVMCMSLCFAGCDLFGGGLKVKAIELTTQFQTVYEKGESLNVSNAIITATLEDDTTKHVAVKKSMISNFDTETPGKKTMIITYKENTCLVPYTVTGYKPKTNYLWYSEDEEHIGASPVYNVVYLHYDGAGYLAYLYSTSMFDDEDSALYEYNRLQTEEYRNSIIDHSWGTVHEVNLVLNDEDYYYYIEIDLEEDGIQLMKVNSKRSVSAYIDGNWVDMTEFCYYPSAE